MAAIMVSTKLGIDRVILAACITQCLVSMGYAQSSNMTCPPGKTALAADIQYDGSYAKYSPGPRVKEWHKEGIYLIIGLFPLLDPLLFSSASRWYGSQISRRRASTSKTSHSNTQLQFLLLVCYFRYVSSDGRVSGNFTVSWASILVHFGRVCCDVGRIEQPSSRLFRFFLVGTIGWSCLI